MGGQILYIVVLNNNNAKIRSPTRAVYSSENMTVSPCEGYSSAGYLMMSCLEMEALGIVQL